MRPEATKRGALGLVTTSIAASLRAGGGPYDGDYRASSGGGARCGRVPLVPRTPLTWDLLLALLFLKKEEAHRAKESEDAPTRGSHKYLSKVAP